MGRDAVVMVVATTMLVGGTYLWQHAQVDDRQVALGRAVSARDAAHSQVSALEGQVAGLQGQIETLSVGKQHTAVQLRATRRRLSRAEARMTALLGSPLADGRYFAAVIVVGANQTPPRLVIDLETYLTGDAAQRAESVGTSRGGEFDQPCVVPLRPVRDRARLGTRIVPFRATLDPWLGPAAG
jgi:TolA-binding protein